MKFKGYLFLIILTLISRIVPIIHFFKKEFLFPNSFAYYPLQPDPYHYYNIWLNYLHPNLIFILHLVLICVSVIYFYKILNSLGINKITCYVTTIFYILFSPMILQTYAGYIDNTSWVLLFTLMIVYYLVCPIYPNQSSIFLNLGTIGLLIILFSLTWSGWFGIVILIFSCLLTATIISLKKLKFFLIMSPFILGVMYIAGRSIIRYFTDYMNEISELQPNLSPIFLLFFVFYLSILFDNIDLSYFKKINIKSDSFHLTIILISVILSLLSFLQRRWTYLGVTFMLMTIAIYNKRYKKNILLITTSVLCIIGLFTLPFTFLNVSPLVNRADVELFNSLEDRIIIGGWHRGHVYNLFTNSEVIDKGHPRYTNKYFIELVNNSNLDVIKQFTNESCYIILDKETLKRYNTSLDLKLIGKTNYEVYSCN